MNHLEHYPVSKLRVDHNHFETPHTPRFYIKLVALSFLVLFFLPYTALAKTVKYELTVRQQPVNMSGKETVDFALTVNGGIPAPTLEFTEGDDAEILVKNDLKNEEVSIHWHGILLPPEEDGVAYVNTPPIHPGTSRLFKFKIRQNGTYWYHSHTAVQEQKGVYGAFIIHPKKDVIKADKEAVVVVSDWSDENADQIVRNLRKDGDYYLYKKDSVRSYLGAIKAGGLGTMLKNEWDRMGGMDLSDVGYDAFLINGKRDSQLLTAHPGDRVRIRVINAAASSYFYVSLGQTPFQVISADGVDISPVWTKEILMGMAETYDILFTVPEHKNYELRATVQDVTGHASAWIGMGEKVPAPDKPMPDLYAPMDHGAHGGSHAGHGDHTGAAPHGDHSAMGSHTGHSRHTEASEAASHAVHSAHGQHKSTAASATTAKHNAAASEGQPGSTADPHAGHGDHSAHIGHSGHSGAMNAHQDHIHGATPGPANKQKGEGFKKQELQPSAQAPIDWSTQSDAMLRQNSANRNLKVMGKVVDTLTVDSLTALEPTTLPKEAKVHDVKLVLGGDMERYIWHINGKAIHEDRLLMINKGEVIRFTFQNDTMMHHPMHFHGHFFRVINESGDRSPLKHTVDVPPHGSRTIEFYANEPGQWMLHCHNLYHMKTGMARVVRYSDFNLTPEMQKHDGHDPHLHDHLYWTGALEASTNHGRAYFRASKTWDTLELEVETSERNKKWDVEGDLLYRRWFGQYFNILAGGTSFHEHQRATIGVGYMLPLMFETDLRIDSKGDLRLDIERRFQWTKNIFTEGELTFRQHEDPEWEVSLMYGPNWHWAAGLMLTDDKLGAGLEWKF